MKWPIYDRATTSPDRHASPFAYLLPRHKVRKVNGLNTTKGRCTLTRHIVTDNNAQVFKALQVAVNRQALVSKIRLYTWDTTLSLLPLKVLPEPLSLILPVYIWKNYSNLLILRDILRLSRRSSLYFYAIHICHLNDCLMISFKVIFTVNFYTQQVFGENKGFAFGRWTCNYTLDFIRAAPFPWQALV